MSGENEAVESAPEHLRQLTAPVSTMIHIDGELAQSGYQATYSASVPDDVVDRAKQARGIFNRYEFGFEDITPEVCQEIIGYQLEGTFAIHRGSEVFGVSSIPSPYTDYRTVETGPGLDEDDWPSFDWLENHHVHSVEYQFKVENERVDEDVDYLDSVISMPDDDRGELIPNERYGYKMVTEWDGRIVFNMYHPEASRYSDEPYLDYAETLAVISEADMER